MIKLKSCPFCGKRPKIKRTVTEDGYYVMCFNPNCKVFVTTMATPTKETVIEQWNRRDGNDNG